MRIFFLACLILISSIGHAQLSDSCKLNIGTNLTGLADWRTEIPFVDLMHTCRTWYTKSLDDPNDPWDSGFSAELDYREDGYPTQMPQQVNGSDFLQEAATVWITDGWPSGEFTVLWDGTGDLSFWGTYVSLNQTEPHRIIFEMENTLEGIVEMQITESDVNDPIRNIRVLMPGTEETHMDQPFNVTWLNRLKDFNTVRFMDWGHTNNWGVDNPAETEPLIYAEWEERSRMDFYTWTHNKGVPYEMMIRLMNDYKLDGWVCVPHKASEGYQRSMAQMFLAELDADRHLYVEYSNEIWNWIFAQTHWLNEHGCLADNEPWPEGIVEFIQATMNYWSDEYSGDLDRVTRVVGTFTAWLDVSERIVHNLDPMSFDAISPSFYFGLNEDQDAILDGLGENATASQIAGYAQENFNGIIGWIDGISAIAENLNKELVFYEGGQHITPHPFGVEPTYGQALIDLQRDPVMYDLYDQWFDELRKYQKGDDPLLLMNFSFIGKRSARYGSWGILEFMDQDLGEIPAPKYQAVLDNNSKCELSTSSEYVWREMDDILLYPNPSMGNIQVEMSENFQSIRVLDIKGQIVSERRIIEGERLDLSDLAEGIYIVQFLDADSAVLGTKRLILVN